jgi:diguanylate cyclase (GGDEF)-like protein
LTRKLGFAVAILLVVIFRARATAQSQLTSLAAIHALSNTDANKRLPVAVQAIVTYLSDDGDNLFIQDGQMAIYVWGARAFKLSPGDRVLITGVTAPRLLPAIAARNIAIVGHGPLPKPVPASFADLVSARFDSMLVTVRGTVRAANPDNLQGANASSGATLRILTDGEPVNVVVNSASASDLEPLLDAEVAVTGVSGGIFEGKRRQVGVAVHVSSLADVKITKPAPANPWSLPTTPMDEIIGAYHMQDLSHRVRVIGTVTYFEPGSALVVQNGAQSLWIRTDSLEPVRTGDEAEAVGFPSVSDGLLNLVAAEVRDLGTSAPVSPSTVTWRELTLARYAFDFVAIDGKVVVAARETEQDEYVLAANGYEFSAVLHHPASRTAADWPSMKDIPVGTYVRVSGICVPDGSTPFRGNSHFNILLRSPNDIVVLSASPWWKKPYWVQVATVLLILTLLIGAPGWYLEHKARREVGSLAYIEQRRGRILEDINNSAPLSETLEKITELVSARLNGAPCWCLIADGVELGNRPDRLETPSLRTAEYPIAARDGPSLGNVFAAFDVRTKPGGIEQEVLARAANLATLAIETSRLYSDLVRRSEFDLLTDVQNRFSMERTLDAMIHNARQSAVNFAVIFIDLNEFKLVNDAHGHLVGDLYLHEVAQRMKRQLRPADTLARVGGDEFAVLVPDVHERTEVEEIARRLESCFDDPFTGDGYVLHGSASIGIALYPEDATTAHSLMGSADAAMYVAKYTKSKGRRSRELQIDDEFASNNRA